MNFTCISVIFQKPKCYAHNPKIDGNVFIVTISWCKQGFDYCKFPFTYSLEHPSGRD